MNRRRRRGRLSGMLLVITFVLVQDTDSTDMQKGTGSS
jgi:hypothetical protein